MESGSTVKRRVSTKGNRRILRTAPHKPIQNKNIMLKGRLFTIDDIQSVNNMCIGSSLSPSSTIKKGKIVVHFTEEEINKAWQETFK
jgi:hypothetical protein